MDQNAVVSFRHRQSPSSDRFLGVFSPPQNETPLGADDDTELNEDDVFWTGSDVTESQLPHSFRPPEKSGILAALPEDHRNPNFPVLRRKPSGLSQSPISRAIPLIPKPPLETCNFNYSKSMPVTARKFQHSAPVNVPMMMMQKKQQRKGELDDIEIDDDDDDEEMLPPHEIVARGSMRSLKTTFSVLEGVGRTLKGRDLRQVRNAVWRQTGGSLGTISKVGCSSSRTATNSLHQGRLHTSTSLGCGLPGPCIDALCSGLPLFLKLAQV